MPILTHESDDALLLGEAKSKCDSSKEYLDDIGFDVSCNRWKGYYEGESDETKKRKAKNRSAVLPPWAGTSVDHMLSRFMVSMFTKKPYFGAFPVKADTEGMIRAKIAQDTLEFQMIQPSPFNNLTRCTQNALAYGFAVLRTGWDFVRNAPTVTNWPVKKFRFPPYTEDFTQLDWCSFISTRFADDILAEDEAFKERYGSPLYQNLKQLSDLKSADFEDLKVKYGKAGGRKPVLIWEYWDEKKKLVIAGEKLIILKTKNPVGFVPAIIFTDIPKLESIFGTGEIEAIEDYIHQIATIVNQRNDNIVQSLIPAWLQNAGIDILNEEKLNDLRPGVRIQVRAPLGTALNTVLWPIPIPMVTQNSYQEVAGYEKNIQDRRGSYPYTRGESPQIRETATGIQSLQAAGSMVAKFILMFMIRCSFIQVPAQLIRWNQEFLEETTILAISETIKSDIPVFRHKVSGKSLQGELFFIEKVSALDPENLKEVKRAQLMQVFQIIGSVMERLPNVDLEGLVRKILATFEEPGLESIVSARPRLQEAMGIPKGGQAQPGGAQALAQRALQQMPKGGSAQGGILGSIMGKVRGGR